MDDIAIGRGHRLAYKYFFGAKPSVNCHVRYRFDMMCKKKVLGRVRNEEKKTSCRSLQTAETIAKQ